jgi:hypothetical protein
MSESESESERKATGAPTAPATDTTADEAAQEELDWGSIDDDDGAFGQIQADSGVSDEGELNLGGRADAEDGKEWSGTGPADPPASASSLLGAIDDGVLGLGGCAEAASGNGDGCVTPPAPAPCWPRLKAVSSALGSARKLGMAVRRAPASRPAPPLVWMVIRPSMGLRRIWSQLAKAQEVPALAKLFRAL